MKWNWKRDKKKTRTNKYHSYLIFNVTINFRSIRKMLNFSIVNSLASYIVQLIFFPFQWVASMFECCPTRCRTFCYICIYLHISIYLYLWFSMRLWKWNNSFSWTYFFYILILVVSLTIKIDIHFISSKWNHFSLIFFLSICYYYRFCILCSLRVITSTPLGVILYVSVDICM